MSVYVSAHKKPNNSYLIYKLSCPTLDMKIETQEIEPFLEMCVSYFYSLEIKEAVLDVLADATSHYCDYCEQSLQDALSHDFKEIKEFFDALKKAQQEPCKSSA